MTGYTDKLNSIKWKSSDGKTLFAFNGILQIDCATNTISINDKEICSSDSLNEAQTQANLLIRYALEAYIK